MKKRVLGNMRLMSELYKQDMVKDWIMVTCIDELLTARPVKGAKMPPEDNIEVGDAGWGWGCRGPERLVRGGGVGLGNKVPGTRVKWYWW